MQQNPFDALLHSDPAGDPDVMTALDAALRTPEPAEAAPAPQPSPPVADEEPIVPVEPEPPAPVPDPAAAPNPPAPPVDDPLAQVAERYRTGRMTPLQKLSTRYMAENPDITPSMAESMAREDLNLPPLGQAVAPPPAETPTADPNAPEPIRAPETAEEIEARIAEIETALLDHGSNEGLNTRETAQLHIDHTRLAAKLESARLAEANARHAEEISHDALRNQSLAEAKAMCSDYQNPASPIHAEIASVMQEYPEILGRPNSPVLVMKIAMANQGMVQSKAGNGNGAVQPPPAIPVPAPAARQAPLVVPPVLPGGSRGAGAPVATVADLNQTLDAMTADELTAVLTIPTARSFKAPIIR